MNAGGKLALFGIAVAGVFGASFAVGSATDPVGLANAEAADHSTPTDEGDGLPGLASTADGFSLVTTTDTIPRGRPAAYSFRIDGEDGPVTEFELEQTKRMHLIVVRRDFVAFVHDHPTMADDGTWTTTLQLDEAGTYRVYADFLIDGDKHTLGADLFVAGEFVPAPLPQPSTTSTLDDGYEVSLEGEIVAGEESALDFVIRRNGAVVRDLPEYLGAKGHLVALRDGDLAYLHVHPEEDRLTFETDFPSAGEYRLFLQFDHGGEIRTAPFTIDVQEA